VNILYIYIVVFNKTERRLARFLRAGSSLAVHKIDFFLLIFSHIFSPKVRACETTLKKKKTRARDT
jgi:hypothetical protein